MLPSLPSIICLVADGFFVLLCLSDNDVFCGVGGSTVNTGTPSSPTTIHDDHNCDGAGNFDCIITINCAELININN